MVTTATGLTSTSDSKYCFLPGDLGGALLHSSLEHLDVLAQLLGHVVERVGERTHLVVGTNGGTRGEVALGHSGRGRGERQDRPGDPPCDEPDPDGQEQRAEEAHSRSRDRQLSGWRKRLVLAEFDQERRFVLREPAIHAHDRSSAVVDVLAVAAFLRQSAIDPVRAQPALGRLRLQPRMQEPPLRRDKVGRTAGPEPRLLEHDSVDPLEVQVCGQDANPAAAAVLIEERCAHGHGGETGQRRVVGVLHGRSRRTLEEERFGRLAGALVLRAGRQANRPLAVEDQQLLRVAGLLDDDLHRCSEAFAGGFWSATGTSASSIVRASSPKPGTAPTNTTLRRCSSIQRSRCVGLDIGNCRQPREYGARQVVRGTGVHGDPHDRDRQRGQQQEVPDESGLEAAPEYPRGRRAHHSLEAMRTVTAAPARSN